jgi:hypothetical protein
MTTALQQAFPGTSVSNATMIAKLAEQGIIVVDDLDAVQSEDFSVQPWSGICALADGALFMYDASDTTSTHDGSTVIVVSGRRYILRSQTIPDYFVVSQGDTTPPGSPSLGDQHIIGAAPSGDWASKAKNITTWTARGWIFRTPQRGQIVWVNDEDTFYHYSDADTWVQGIPVSGITNGSLSPIKFRHPLALLTVEDVRNAPPVSIPADGTAYVVDTSPTGAFAGEAGAVAYVDGGAYVFIDPFEGATVYDKDQGFDLCYRSGAWERKVPGSAFPNVYYAESTTVSSTVFGIADIATLFTQSVTGVSTSNRWRIEVFLNAPSLTVTSPEFLRASVFVDAESTAREFVHSYGQAATSGVYSTSFVFFIDVPDLSSHDIIVKLGRQSGASGNLTLATGTKYRLQITEVKG